MRSLFLGSLATVLVAGSVLVACGDSSGTGATGGGGNGAGSEGGNGGTPSTGGTPSNGGGGNGGSGGSIPTDCTEITADDFGLVNPAGPFVYIGTPNPALATDLEDQFRLELYDDTLTGSFDLTDGDDANYATCLNCFLVYQDIDQAAGSATFFFQAGGTVDYGASVPPLVAGSVTDLTLVEVTIDPETFESAPVPGGACLHVASLDFDIQAPKDWTCAVDQWNGGAGNGCDCECGAHDPDCDLEPAEVVDGCGKGEVCGAGDTCIPPVPDAWACNDAFWGDGDCDCGCAVQDVDCPDLLSSSCDFCDDTGSCDTVACDDPNTNIDPDNNAICLPAG